MVQLIEKISTPKTKKSTMAKVKTPAKTPKTAAIKHNDVVGTPKDIPVTPKHEKTPRLIQAVQKKESLSVKKTPKCPKTPKQEDNSKVGIPLDLEGTPKQKIYTAEETPKLKKTPKPVKTPKLNSELEPESTPKRKDSSNQKKVAKGETPKPVKTPKQKVRDEPEGSLKKLKSRKASQNATDDPMETVDILPSLPKKQDAVVPTKRKSTDSDHDHPSKRRAVEDEHTIYVGGLKATTSEEALQEYFSQFGKVQSVTLPKTKMDFRFGFVQFVDKECISNVLAVKEHEVQGSKVIVRSRKFPKEDAKNGEKENLVKDFEIRVLGLAKHLTSANVKKYFEKFGTVSSVTLPTIRSTRKNKGFAFVAFSSDEEMKAALAERYHTIGNQEASCFINEAKEEKKAANPDRNYKLELIIQGLSYKTTSQEIQEHFQKFGQISNISLPIDKYSGKNRGFAFVAFTKSKEVKAVLNEQKHKIGPNFVTCVKNEPQQLEKKSDIAQEFVIFCKNITPKTKEADLKEYFSQFGPVTKVTLPYNKKLKQIKGFAFVAFSCQEEVDAVLAKKHKIGGRFIVCQPNLTEESREKSKGAKKFEIVCKKINPTSKVEDLKEYFSQFGPVTKVTLPFNKKLNRNKRIAFVAFSSQEEVDAVLAKKHKVGGLSIVCLPNLGENTSSKKATSSKKSSQKNNEKESETDVEDEEDNEELDDMDDEKEDEDDEDDDDETDEDDDDDDEMDEDDDDDETDEDDDE